MTKSSSDTAPFFLYNPINTATHSLLGKNCPRSDPDIAHMGYYPYPYMYKHASLITYSLLYTVITGALVALKNPEKDTT